MNIGDENFVLPTGHPITKSDLNKLNIRQGDIFFRNSFGLEYKKLKN